VEVCLSFVSSGVSKGNGRHICNSRACVVANGRIGELYCGYIYRAPIFTVSCDAVSEENFPTFQMYCGIEGLSWLTSGL